MKRSEIQGLEGAAVNQVGLQYCLFFCAWIDKESHCLTQLGPPNLWNSAQVSFPIPRWPGKGVTWSSLMRCLWNPPLLRNTIWSTLLELRYSTRSTPVQCITRNCGSLNHALCMKGAISLSETPCYTFYNCFRNYGSTRTVLHAPMWYSVDLQVATPREALPMLKWHPKIWH